MMKCTLLVVLILWCTDQCTSSVNNTLLRRVKRLENSSNIDHYFGCNVVGRFLIWQYNDITIRGFFPSDIGDAVVSSRSGVQFTTTLLASRTHVNDTSLAELDSILVVSFEDVMDPSPFMITCSNGVESNVTNSTTLTERVVDSDKKKNIAFDHILSSTIVLSRLNTHVFVCGSNSDFQFLKTAGPLISFSQSDTVGEMRTIISSDRSTVNIQGILMAQDLFNKTTLLIVPEDGMVDVRCFYDNEHQVELPSQHQVELPSPSTTTDISTTRQLLLEPITSYTSDSSSTKAISTEASDGKHHHSSVSI